MRFGIDGGLSGRVSAHWMNLRRRLLPGLAIAAALVTCLAAPAFANGFKVPHLAKPKRGVQMKIGPVTVERGKEITECTYFKMPGKKDMAVNQVHIKVSGGSHHVHLYRAQDPGMTLPDHAEACNFALDFSVWQLVLASQSLDFHWTLPKGIAFHFTHGEQLAAQTHFVDSGLLTTPTGQGWAIFNLGAVPEKKVTSYAGAFFGQDRDVDVPPHTLNWTQTTQCYFPKPVKLLGLTGHYHYRGKIFVASTWDPSNPTDPGIPLYRQDGYLDPPFRTFTAKGETPPEIQGIQWTCAYDNNDDVEYKFGPFTDANEHCNLFFFYYPSITPGSKQEDMTCVKNLHTVTGMKSTTGLGVTTVRDN